MLRRSRPRIRPAVASSGFRLARDGAQAAGENIRPDIRQKTQVKWRRQILVRKLADVAEMAHCLENIPNAGISEAADFNIDEPGITQQSLEHQLAEKTNV